MVWKILIVKPYSKLGAAHKLFATFMKLLIMSKIEVIDKSAKLRKLEKKLIREQRSLSRKYENLKKGESTQKRNIQKTKA